MKVMSPVGMIRGCRRSPVFGAGDIRRKVSGCLRIGSDTKRDNLIDVSLLEFCVREHLNKMALRRMVVFDPLKVVLTDYPDREEVLKSEDNPEDVKISYPGNPVQQGAVYRAGGFYGTTAEEVLPAFARAEGAVEERVYHSM